MSERPEQGDKTHILGCLVIMEIKVPLSPQKARSSRFSTERTSHSIPPREKVTKKHQ